MDPILWAAASTARSMRTLDWANHLVIETEEPAGDPQFREVPWHWVSREEGKPDQIGFVLRQGVRVGPWADGAEPSASALMFLSDVVAGLEHAYGGERVLVYRNPDYEGDDVVNKINTDVEPTTLYELCTRQASRAKGGRSRSEAKLAAARANLAEINEAKQAEAESRVTRYQHLREGGLTLREIAEREETSVNAVKCLLKRARRVERAEQAEAEVSGQQWAERLAQRRIPTRSDEQRRRIAQYPGAALTEHEDGSITLDVDEVMSLTV